MNPDFFEVTGMEVAINSTADGSLPWQENWEDKEWRYAREEFFQKALPEVKKLFHELTPRQRQVVTMHFIWDMTQQEIASSLGLNQSTVSRHLYGTIRNGQICGGAIKKLRGLVDTKTCPAKIFIALRDLQIAKTRIRDRAANSLYT